MKPRTFKAIILEDLNRRGLQVIARKIKSITYESFSMGNAVRVRTENLFKTERETLNDILQGYAYGRFDAMTDCSSSEKDPMKERQAKYVTLTNEFSPAIDKTIRLKLSAKGIIDDKTSLKRLDCYLDQAVWRELNLIEDFDELLEVLT